MRINPKSRPGWSWLGFLVAVLAGMLVGWWLLASLLPGLAAPDSPIPTRTSEPINASPPAATPTLSLARNPPGGLQPGSPAPDFTLPTLDKALLSLSAFRGEVVLINFWTTWCPPCKLEMPALQQAFDRYNEQGFVVLAVNWTEQDDPLAVEPFVKELGLTFPILLDVDGVVSGKLYSIIGLPTSIFVDRDGIVSEFHIGPLDLDDLDARIQDLLGESK